MTSWSRPIRTEQVERIASVHRVIPLFANNAAHSSVPLNDLVAAARSAGQERPQAGACVLLLTGASTATSLPYAGSASTRSVLAWSIAIGLLAALTAAMVIPSAAQSLAAVPVESATFQMSDPCAPYVAEAARRFGIPESWIRAVMQAESAGDPQAVSKRGAIGLMQIMPATWQELQDRYSLGDDPYDLHDNIIAGTAYLREMYDRYGPDGFLAAYNAGPRRYEASHNGGAPLPVETERYVAILKPLIEGLHFAPIIRRSTTARPRQSSTLFARATGATFDRTRMSFPPLSPHLSHGGGFTDLTALVPSSRDLFVVRFTVGRRP